MTNFDDIFERIKQATQTRTQVELADVLEIRQSSISDAKRRSSIPADWYMKLFEQYGLNPDWLKKGTGPMSLRNSQGYTTATESIQSSILNEEPAAYGYGHELAHGVTVPISSSQPKQADGEVQALGKLSIPQSFFAPGLSVIRVDSSAMEPVILKGAYVGIDTSQRSIFSGEFYGVSLPYEGLTIKKIFVDSEQGRLLLRSENPEHPEVYLPLANYEEHIAGRVSWVLQRF